MDKMSKAYGELFKQIIPKSPLEEALKRFNETYERLNKEQNEE